MKALKVEQIRRQASTGWKAEVGDSAILSCKEDFAAYFKNRYGLNKGETKGMELAYSVLIGWNVTTVDWPTENNEMKG